MYMLLVIPTNAQHIQSVQSFPHPMQLLNLGITIVHSHTLPLQRPTTPVAFFLHELLIWERLMDAWGSWRQGGRKPAPPWQGYMPEGVGERNLSGGRRARWRRRPAAGALAGGGSRQPARSLEGKPAVGARVRSSGGSGMKLVGCQALKLPN
jgi:hypothetical protein